jgi:RimJ/RimL family protein N-acetyltransferase
MQFDFITPVILEDNRVRLEPLEEKHFEHLMPIALREPGLLKYSPSPFGTQEKLREYFNLAYAHRNAEKRYAFVIYDKLEKKYAGSTSMGEISNKDCRLQLGWTWMGKQFRGSGLNLHCKFLLLRYIFETLKFERVEFFTDSRNEPSKKAIVKIGGKLEGELRSHTVLADGYRRNTLVFSILKHEWAGIKFSLLAKL